MNLPQEFIATIQNTFGDGGHAWLIALPDLINKASHNWNLTDIQPVSNLSYNFVAFAKRFDEDVVLKIGVPNRELTSEMSALKLFDGKAQFVYWKQMRNDLCFYWSVFNREKC